MIRCSLFLLMTCAAAFAAQPNILLIITDDQGYGDLSIHGNTVLETPNLDALAKESVRLEQFHVAPCCAPTRAALLTGRNHHEAGVWGVHWGRDYLSLDETTIAEVLRDTGYDTGMIGKWHSGRASAWLPWNRGFNEAWVSELYRHKDPKVSYNGKLMETEGYADETLTDIAIDFIQRDRKGEPWFLLMSYMSPHGPWVSPPAYVEKYKTKGCSERFAILNGMIDHMDAQIGRLVGSVDAENTVVIFMSDNGPINKNDKDGALTDKEAAIRNPAGMRGQKGNIWQNATRVPCFIRWPGQFKPARVDALADVTDVFPTLVELAGAGAPETAGPIQGRSLMPLLRGGKQWAEPRELFKPYWRPFWNESWSNDGAVDTSRVAYNNQLNSLFREPYKLVSYRGKTPELYNVLQDPGEKKDVAAQNRKRVESMSSDMREAYDAMIASGRVWQQPRFPIGHPEFDAYDRVGEVLSGSHIPFCSSVKDEGNVVCKSHHSVGWKAAGDAQTILVDVVTPGTYALSLEAKRFVAGTRARLEVGESQLDFILTDQKWRIEAGTIDLDAGPQNLRLSLLNVPPGSGEVIEQMKMALLERL